MRLVRIYSLGAMLEYINILTWLRGFQDKRVLILGTEGQKKLNLKNCNFHIESV